VAIGTRTVDDSLREKGIIIKMVETSNNEFRKRSALMHKDPDLQDIQGDLLATSLNYYEAVKEACDTEEITYDLTGRDWNKYLPFLGLAKVIGAELPAEPSLYQEIKALAIKKKNKRRGDVQDVEEILLVWIIENIGDRTTYKELAGGMQDLGYDNYRWQTAKSDLDKLGIIKKIDKDVKPVQILIDIERAKTRAKKRGIILKGGDSPGPGGEGVFDKNRFTEIMEDKSYEEISIVDLTMEDLTTFQDIFLENRGSLGVLKLLDTYMIRTGYSMEKVVGIHLYLKDNECFSGSGNHLMKTNELDRLIEAKKEEERRE
jgi:hypothetical protein